MSRYAVILALMLGGLSTASAAPKPAETAKIDLGPKTRRAGSAKPIPGSARPYAEAKRLLARGQAAAALKALQAAPSSLFGDREALLRGDALLAIGEKEAAKAAYLQAVETAQVASVSRSAGRALVSVLGQLREHEEQLRWIDALMAVEEQSRKPGLLYQRADVLRLLGRYQEAVDTAFKVLQHHPGAPVAINAERLLRGMEKKGGVKVPVTTGKLELARIHSLIRSGAHAKAKQALDALEKQSPELARGVELTRAEMYRVQKNRGEERASLKKLYDRGLTDEDGAEILFRLGKLGMAVDDDAAAIARFDELGEKYPRAKQAREGQYLAGWIPYNKGNYPEATRRMLEFAERHKKAKQRTEALWYAGWAAYLAKDDALARRAFTQLIEDHPTTDLRTHARYWMGRMAQRGDDLDGARANYREVLKAAPLSYYGFWSMARLEELGETVVLEPPPELGAPASIKQVIALLGEERPVGIDRAVLFHEAGLPDETLEELTAVERYLRGVKNTQGRTMVADMLHELGAHHMAFLVAMGITADGAELVTGAPWAWRAWRHAYPKAYDRFVTDSGKRHEVEDALILSIMRTESHFRPHVRSPVGARGLMQVMPNTARLIGNKSKDAKPHAARFTDPESNVWLGTWYLKQLLERYSGQPAAAIGAYNAGPGAMDRWLDGFGGMELDEFVERVPYRETRRYIRRVLETYMVYRRLDGKDLPKLVGRIERLPVAADAVSF